jgi:hypothetical protein
VQAYIDGLPIFTQLAYGWSNSEVGIMLGVLGLAAPLVNFSVGRVSSHVPDRHITARPPPIIPLLRVHTLLPIPGQHEAPASPYQWTLHATTQLQSVSFR